MKPTLQKDHQPFQISSSQAAGHSRLIFLAFFQIAEFQQISDHRNHELLLFRLLRATELSKPESLVLGRT